MGEQTERLGVHGGKGTPVVNLSAPQMRCHLLVQQTLFIEITVADPSEFATRLEVHSEVKHRRYRVLTVESAHVRNALAALLLHSRDTTGYRPHIYFEWTEGHPAAHFLPFLFFGVGEVARP